jgi:hypothetical protein
VLLICKFFKKFIYLDNVSVFFKKKKINKSQLNLMSSFYFNKIINKINNDNKKIKFIKKHNLENNL